MCIRDRLSRALARSQGQAVRHHIDQDEGEHQQHREPNSPISMRVPPKGTAQVNVIPWLGSFALDIVFVRAHFVTINKAQLPCEATLQRDCSLAADSSTQYPRRL